jgi:hypothetical protein
MLPVVLTLDMMLLKAEIQVERMPCIFVWFNGAAASNCDQKDVHPSACMLRR